MSNEDTDDWDEPTTGERARARAFGDVVDKVVAGRAPAAMTADDSPLVEVATVIRAAHGKAELAPARQRSIIEAALARAVDAGDDVPHPTKASPTRAPSDIVPIESGWRRRAPWVIAGVSTALAAAAAVFLMMRGPERQLPEGGDVALPTPIEHRSRPADALIGPIPRERSGDAVSRIDAIFADRLDGYRARSYGGAR